MRRVLRLRRRSGDPAPKGCEGPLDRGTKLALDRTVLAHERNLLAWVRSVISLVALGFSVHHFFRTDEERLGDEIGPVEVGTLMVLVGFVALILAALQHRRDMRGLRESFGTREMPGSYAGFLVAMVGMLCVAALLSTFLGY